MVPEKLYVLLVLKICTPAEEEHDLSGDCSAQSPELIRNTVKPSERSRSSVGKRKPVERGKEIHADRCWPNDQERTKPEPHLSRKVRTD